MTDPQVPHDGQMAQVLIEIGKLSTSVAVIGTKQDALKETFDKLPIDSIEQRLGQLERDQAKLSGSRDMFSRVVATAAGLIAAGSGVAAWLAIAHR